MRRNRIFPVALVLILSVLACASTTVSQQATIALNAEITFQTIEGWEATTEATRREAASKRVFNKYKDTLLDLTVNDLGINRVRLEIKNGAENPIDYFTQYDQGQISRALWRAHRYEIINDNDDPFTINPAGFHFGQVDVIVEELVLPIKERLQARGEKLYINFNYVDFGPSAFEHRNHPEEYAEFMLAAFEHLSAKYGWTPDAIEVVLEADNAGWSGAQIGQAIVSTGKRLKARGFLPAFIAPSTADMAKAVPFFDQLIQTPGVAEYFSELSYHRYGGASDTTLRAIASRAINHGIKTAHLELIGAGYRELHQDLTLGRNSSWSQYTLAWPLSDGTDDGGKYYVVDDRDPENPRVVAGTRTKYLRQYFKYVRRGAVRIQATSNEPNFEPVAFVNADCKQVVIINAESRGAFVIQGLPAGSYGIKYTTGAQNNADHPDATLSTGQSLQTSIPGTGVITIYAKSVSCAGITPVSAADYRGNELGAESIATIFGKELAGDTFVAQQSPQPTTLGGTMVKIKDSRDVDRLAPLFLVSPRQVTYQIPPGTAPGPATVSVISAGRLVGLSGVTIARVAPGLFTANATGEGVAAAVVLRVKKDGSQGYEPVVQFDAVQRQLVPLPIDLSSATDQVFLVLYGTGIRGYSAPTAVTARIGGIEAPVTQALPLTPYAGVDQVTIRLPKELAGQGEVSVSLTVDGKLARPVSINVK